jgi:hypothetical protein
LNAFSNGGASQVITAFSCYHPTPIIRVIASLSHAHGQLPWSG